MNGLARAVCFGCLIAAQSAVQAAQCVPSGGIVYRGTDEKSLIFFLPRAEHDLRFELPGHDFANDDGAPPNKMEFFVDGVHYELLGTAVSEFLQPGEQADPRQILPRHAASEHGYAVRSGGLLKDLQVLDQTVRPAFQDTPALYFLRWKLHDASARDMPAQYFLSTVVGDSVVVLSAIVPKPEQEALARTALDRFSTSFQFLAEEDCPKPPKP